MDKPKDTRSAQEIAKAVSRAITTINKVAHAVSVMRKYDFFIPEKFYNKGIDKLIKDVCAEFEVNEAHIRKVGGWNLKSGL